MSRMGAPRDLEDRIGKRLFRNPRMRLTVLVRLTFLESAFDPQVRPRWLRLRVRTLGETGAYAKGAPMRMNPAAGFRMTR